ncbi:MAG: outer membrane protein transport protein [Leptospirales bacterium]|nr:outer membrane protein transport protein [Leptospirales bacterium]
MKRFTLMLILAIMTLSSAVFAGNEDYMSTQSAKFIMNTASVARTEGADIASYNPAGTAFLDPGLYFDLSNQFLLKSYSTKAKENNTTRPIPVLNKEYKEREPAFILPNFYFVGNFGDLGIGKLATFLQAGIIGGDGNMKWNGTTGSNAFVYRIMNALTTAPPAALLEGLSGATFSTSFETSSVYYGIGIGAAYSFFEDTVSASLGIKYVMAKKTGKLNGSMNFTERSTNTPVTFNLADEYDYDANGFTPVIGIDVKPNNDLTIGLRYEMETNLEFKYKAKKRSVSSRDDTKFASVINFIQPYIPDYGGMKAKQNLPAILSLGGEYIVMPELTLGLALTMYFKPKVEYINYKYDPAAPPATTSVEKSNGLSNGYEVALSGVYKVVDEFKLGLSFMYTIQGIKNSYLEDPNNLLATSANPILNSLNIGFGGTYTFMEDLEVTLAFNWEYFFAKSIKVAYPGIDPLKMDYKKSIYGIYLGVGYRLRDVF